MFKILAAICNRAFSSPRGMLSSKRIGGAILLSSAIFKGFIVIAFWMYYRSDIPLTIVQIIEAELMAGTATIGSTIFEKKFKTNEASNQI